MYTVSYITESVVSNLHIGVCTQPVSQSANLSPSFSVLLLLLSIVNKGHLTLLSEGLHGIGVINVIMPRPKMVETRTDAGRIARIVRMRTGSDGQLREVLLNELCEPLANKDVALSAQMQAIVQVFGPRLVRAGRCILHILPQVEMRNVELVGDLGGCLCVLAR